jgi:hypothetical protein
MLTFQSVFRERGVRTTGRGPNWLTFYTVDALGRVPTCSGNISRLQNVRSYANRTLFSSFLQVGARMVLRSVCLCCSFIFRNSKRLLCCMRCEAHTREMLFSWGSSAGVFFPTSYVHRVASARNSNVAQT